MAFLTEADTCRRYVLPKLYAAGWTDEQISEQRSFTDGRIVVTGAKVKRREQKRADYLLRYRRDFPIAVVEAKTVYANSGDGLQQAKEYAQILGLKFAYATNGHGIVEHDFITGRDNDLDGFPSADELWRRLRQSENIDDKTAERVLAPYYHLSGKSPRYYQEIAINRAVQAILQGKRRALLTLATGTGKTVIAFQICYKLWKSLWNRTGEPRRPRILYLADRNVLLDVPKDQTFAPFGDARWKIEGQAVKSREMYFATYQAIAKDERRPGLYRDFPQDFFDLIIVDECHRGSARYDSSWREILDYFEPAFQLGMTATPLRQDNRDTYAYFGNPLYTYSLKQGIEDGFLAPYRVHRVVSTVDAAGWRPSKGEMDRYGREIPDEQYGTKDFERLVSLKVRSEAIANNISDFLKKTNDRFAKTIVFCVDQEHAEDMRKALNNCNTDISKDHPDYVARVVSDEGSVGRGYLDRFMDVEKLVPALVTTSQMLTTGVDVPTCRNVVLARVINSMTDFKQIIGRGTRVRDDYDKLYFNIIDYTGATRLFADPDFDGEPALITEEEMNEAGQTVTEKEVPVEQTSEPEEEEVGPLDKWLDEEEGEDKTRRKYYVDGGSVEIVAHLVQELDENGKQLRVVKFTDYTADKVRSMYSAAALRSKWSTVEERAEIIRALEDRGILFEELAKTVNQPDADPFDLLCHVAFNAPLRTRRERAENLRKNKKDFFDQYKPEARAVLNEMLDKYIEYSTAQFQIPEILKVPPISERGTVPEIAAFFGGAEKMRAAVGEMQALLYAS
ncbi:MAG: DEAD/DEAH box helicase family protein [Acidobacteriia bacterium]|nr:DEAD/DEAH box helicase family protein [Terriglobia bacterium]